MEWLLSGAIQFATNKIATNAVLTGVSAEFGTIHNDPDSLEIAYRQRIFFKPTSDFLIVTRQEAELLGSCMALIEAASYSLDFEQSRGGSATVPIDFHKRFARSRSERLPCLAKSAGVHRVGSTFCGALTGSGNLRL